MWSRHPSRRNVPLRTNNVLILIIKKYVRAECLKKRTLIRRTYEMSLIHGSVPISKSSNYSLMCRCIPRSKQPNSDAT